MIGVGVVCQHEAGGERERYLALFLIALYIVHAEFVVHAVVLRCKRHAALGKAAVDENKAPVSLDGADRHVLSACDNDAAIGEI